MAVANKMEMRWGIMPILFTDIVKFPYYFVSHARFFGHC